MKIFCGTNPTQTIQWLGNAAVARTDEENFEGWKKYGAPTVVRKGNNEEGIGLEMSASIKSCLRDGDFVYVETALCE